MIQSTVLLISYQTLISEVVSGYNYIASRYFRSGQEGEKHTANSESRALICGVLPFRDEVLCFFSVVVAVLARFP